MPLAISFFINVLITAQIPEYNKTPLFDPQEQATLNKYKSQIFADMYQCPTHNQKALLDCAKVAFGKAFTPFENEWNSVELNSQTPISIEELRKEASDCVLNCAIRNDYSTFQKCLPRCERIMEGAAEVEKRKAISNLNAYQPSFMSAASSDPFASVAQEMSFLTPLSSKAKKNERMELAEKNARVLLNRRAHPPQ